MTVKRLALLLIVAWVITPATAQTSAMFLSTSVESTVAACHEPVQHLAALAAAKPVPVDRNTAASFLAERLSLWQQRLNLQDWKIGIALTPRSELKPGTLGKIRWDKSNKSAVIQIISPSDYRLPADEIAKDMEFTLVHELIHLELASLPRNEASRRTEEYAVNNIARALLGLYHGK